jgi:hypothetical protein
MPNLSSYLKGCFLAALGGSVTLHEILVNGSLLLTCSGGVLAVLGGYWAYCTKRLENRTAVVELRMKELELRRAQERGPE